MLLFKKTSVEDQIIPVPANWISSFRNEIETYRTFIVGIDDFNMTEMTKRIQDKKYRMTHNDTSKSIALRGTYGAFNDLFATAWSGIDIEDLTYFIGTLYRRDYASMSKEELVEYGEKTLRYFPFIPNRLADTFGLSLSIEIHIDAIKKLDKKNSDIEKAATKHDRKSLKALRAEADAIIKNDDPTTFQSLESLALSKCK